MTSEAKIRTLLDDGQIERLFRNELLWDKPTGIGPVTVSSGTATYQVRPVAAKKNFVVFECDSLPTADERVRIERAVARRAIENLVVYKGQDGARQVVWTEAKPGRAPHAYVHDYTAAHSNEDLLQRLAQLAFTLADQASLNLVTVRARVQSALAADRVTKSFYDSFAKQHATLSLSIEHIADEDDRSWYSSVLLNRLMFLYFLQRKGFLDGDRAYLRNRLTKIRELRGPDNFYTFFREFLLPLFHTSLAARDSQPDDAEIADLIGDVPYLNGGMFARHKLERRYENVEVPDAAFEAIFRFFDSWKWTLDDRETAGGNEINADILGYIFERYINQKQMGAYYTKEDVTGYMTSATIVPWFLDRLTARLAERGLALDPYEALVASGDRYLYAAPLTGVDEPLPPGFPATSAAMAGDERAGQPASPKYGLPGESWTECLDRIDSQRRLRTAVNNGDTASSTDAVTANINLIALATDLLRDTESADVLEVAYEVLTELTVLDPACGSGAFLFAALDLLVVLHRTCIESMEQHLVQNTQVPSTDTTERFAAVLSEAAKHPSRDYFLHKSVTLNNLFGVDLMPEAVEIAKLRLFLSLVEHIGSADELEPLPDLDFNLRAGNSVVGFTSPEQVDAVLAETLDGFDTADRVLHLTEAAGEAYEAFMLEQVDPASKADMHALKAKVESRLAEARVLLNDALATEHQVPKAKRHAWETSSAPFHWFTEFYSVMRNGGFDVVLGNPPYVPKSKVAYKVIGLTTAGTPDIYAPMTERGAALCAPAGRLAMILPISAQFSDDFKSLREVLTRRFPARWLSTFSRNPAALFDAGLGVRSTIVLAGPASEELTYVTRTHRWVETYRPTLFEALRYTLLPAEIATATESWPRTYNTNTAALIQKMLKAAPGRLVSTVRKRGNEHQLGMKSIGLYWISCYSKEPPSYTLQGTPIPHTAVRGIPFDNDDYRDAALAIAASKTMLFWWACNGDDFNVTGGLLMRLPVDLRKLAPEEVAELAGIGRDLAKALPEHVQYTKYAQRWMGNYVLPELRHITDRADAVLARIFDYADALADLDAFYWSFYKPTGERPGTLREVPTFT